MSAFLKLVAARQSVRKYTARAVPRKAIASCLEAARLAPSGENCQPWRFVVVDDPQLKDSLAAAATAGIYAPTRFIKKAPLLIAVLAKKNFFVHRLGSGLQGTQFWLLDIGMACQQLVLRAQEQGIGSCYIGWFSARGAAKALGLSRRDRVVLLLALGYPEDPALRPRKRKALADIVRYNEPF